MTSSTLIQFGGLLTSSFLVAFAAFALMALFEARSRRPARGFMIEGEHAIAFLFDDTNLVNATSAAKQILSGAAEGRSDWARLVSLLLPRFPDLLEQLEELADLGRVKLTSSDGTSQLEAEWRDGLARICLLECGGEDARGDIDRHSLAALERELATLRGIADHAPWLMWREGPEGTITWANAAYLKLATDSQPDPIAPSWPPARLFDLTAAAPASKPGRHSVKLPKEAEPRWFDLCGTPMAGETLFMAVDADRTVRAETSLREFVQTLTKTFAHLTVGLAIFDKSRKLTLFNPALADLTHLPPEFLISRPSLQSLLDRLRDRKILPEPKDYRSWRQQMQELETAAVTGTYEETWSLPSGQTYRVSGRPHPDGAVAFVFEDISAEISLTRRFRAELETSQAVLDSLDEAIAVFSASGSMILSNSAYARLWGVDPSTMVSAYGIRDAARSWNQRCAPSPVWGDLRDFVTRFGERADWTAEVRLRDGRQLDCRIAPLSGGATLIGFRTNTARRLENRQGHSQSSLQATGTLPS